MLLVTAPNRSSRHPARSRLRGARSALVDLERCAPPEPVTERAPARMADDRGWTAPRHRVRRPDPRDPSDGRRPQAL